MEYGQFCPVAKATEILGEKWTLLIIRELLMGGTRFSELQRGLSLISPTILTKRLGTLEDRGLVIRKKIPGQRGYEYFPTESCKELLPVVRSLGDWGMRWARKNLSPSDYDVELLMLYLKRSVQPDKLPGKQTVIHFKFTDIQEMSRWWIVADEAEIDICTNDPGKDVDVFFTTNVKTMADIWMGDTTYRKMIASGAMLVTGPNALTRDIGSWLAGSDFADLPPAREI
ncbi:MAG: helix-turn-helix transcriptional regulator [Acidobacteria bacterium]|uniref:Helix-turn-helix transcriptional regulator n=1 Tax=Candidatus Polarisedimenticola svalbardensis TaxID=2886004 RepID=A0A8J6XYZ2_9BACT|nr:helix-turn-helix transcriptional regulator [Candidatus Polarisedimenticola svalbardensis]